MGNHTIQTTCKLDLPLRYNFLLEVIVYSENLVPNNVLTPSISLHPHHLSALSLKAQNLVI